MDPYRLQLYLKPVYDVLPSSSCANLVTWFTTDYLNHNLYTKARPVVVFTCLDEWAVHMVI
jgi:hypothetical protein